jgi:hypothetical protein
MRIRKTKASELITPATNKWQVSCPKVMQECWLPYGYNSTNVQFTSTGITIINMAAVNAPQQVILPPAVGDADPNDDPNVLDMDIALQWIGFNDEATRNRIRIEGFETFEDLKSMKDKDIRDLAESYGRRTAGDGRFIFGVRRIRYLIGMIHWVQDFARINKTPSLDDFAGNPVAFRTALDEASTRADVRKVEKDQSDTVSKAADPGKFKDERKWPEWEPAFVNYL